MIDRGGDRYRRATLTTITALLARGLTTVAGLALIPLSIRSLGAERYGVWVTVTSFVALFAFADLGLGNGLMNAVAESNGRNDLRSARGYVSSAAVVFVVVALVVLVGFWLAYPRVDWASLLQTNSDRSEVAGAIAVTVCCLAAGIPLGGLTRVQIGLQEGYVTNLWQILGGAVAFGAATLVLLGTASVAWLVAAWLGTPLLATLANLIQFYGRRQKLLRPALAWVSADATRRLFRLGALFFVLQISSGIAFASDSLIATRALGPSAAGHYAVAQRLFLTVPLLLSVAGGSLWPAYTEAIARNDWQWIRRTLWRTATWFTVVAAVGSIALIVFATPIFTLWVGVEFVPPPLLLIGLASWVVLSAFGSTFAVVLNAANVLTFQLITGLLMAVVSILLRVALLPHMGLSALPWGLVLAYVLLTVLPTLLYFRARLPECWPSHSE